MINTKIITYLNINTMHGIHKRYIGTLRNFILGGMTNLTHTTKVSIILCIPLSLSISVRFMKNTAEVIKKGTEAAAKTAQAVESVASPVGTNIPRSGGSKPAADSSTTSTTKVSPAGDSSTSTTPGSSRAVGSQTNTTTPGDTGYKLLPRRGSPEKVVSVLDRAPHLRDTHNVGEGSFNMPEALTRYPVVNPNYVPILTRMNNEWSSPSPLVSPSTTSVTLASSMDTSTSKPYQSEATSTHVKTQPASTPVPLPTPSVPHTPPPMPPAPIPDAPVFKGYTHHLTKTIIPPKPILDTQSDASGNQNSPTPPITPEVLVDQIAKLKKPFLNIPHDTKIPSWTQEESSEIVKKLTNDDLVGELVGRDLAKKYPKNTDTTVLTEDGKSIVVGLVNQPVSIKLTPHGVEYFKENEKKKTTPQYEDTTSVSPQEFKIIVVPSTQDTFIASGKQTHLIVASKGDGYYDILGCLTSKAAYTKIADIQFKKFQEQGGSTAVGNTKGKSQYFMESTIRERVLKDNAIVIKQGTEYLKAINLIPDLVKKQKEFLQITYSFFNKDGYTKTDVVEVCKDFNTNVKMKKGHYKTDAEKAEKVKQQEKKDKHDNTTKKDDIQE